MKIENFKIAILTVSDKGSKGERVDTAGPAIKDCLKDFQFMLAAAEIVPDERDIISQKLIQFADDLKCDLVFTTGGTGFSPRDVTPEATLAVIDRAVPGIPEAMRVESLKITPKAMLSRAVAGIRKQTLIINLSGSEKAVREQMAVILPVLKHAVDVLRGEGNECGR
jgi:molybdopterin adenylyltransferase